MSELGRCGWLLAANVLLGIVEILALVGGYWCWGIYLDDETPFFFVLGLVYGHVLLIAALLAMGPWKWQRRIPLLLAIYLATVAGELVLFGRIFSDTAPSEVFAFLGASTFVLLITLQLPLGPKFRWWRIARLEATGSDAEEAKTFSIRDLFLWTTIVAVTLAIGRTSIGLLPRFDSGDITFGRITFVFGLLLLCSLLIAWPAIWAMWSQQWRARLAISVLIACGATCAEIFALSAAIDNIDLYEAALAILPKNIIAYGSLLMHLAIVRWFGYRLVSVNSAKTAAAAA